jgi:LysR family transcriptional regulator for metE and metH
LEDEFDSLRKGRTGRLHIAIECHACFDWLLPVLEAFRVSWPDIDVDIRPGLQFEALPALLREEVDFVVSSDPEPLAGVEPKSIRQVELSAVILLLVASGRGVSVLPDWVVRDTGKHPSLVTRRLTETGITRRLFGATRADDTAKPFMAQMLRLCRTEPPKLQRA